MQRAAAHSSLAQAVQVLVARETYKTPPANFS
jgi:hypothetical protein